MRRFLLGAIIAFTVGLWAVANAQTTYEYDLAFESLIGRDSVRYVFGSEIPLQARFINRGSKDIDSGARVHCIVYEGEHGMTIAEAAIMVDSLWPAGTSRDIFIVNWPPYVPVDAKYHVRYCTKLKSDENTDNDCSAGYAGTFYTIIDSSIAAGSPDKDMHQPLADKGYVVGEPLPVEIPFANLSTSKLADVPLRAVIHASYGAVVYDRAISAELEPGKTSTVQFPDFTPQAPGTHCISAWSNYSTDDVPENDTLSWCFTVVQTSVAGVGSKEPSTATIQLSVMPNPVSHSATLHYATPGTHATSITICDASGRLIRTIPITSNSDTGILNFDIEGLPSGAYIIQLVIPDGSGTTARMMIQN